jgi:uncharacterized hydrophobic protein (TIGR00271 family)
MTAPPNQPDAASDTPVQGERGLEANTAPAAETASQPRPPSHSGSSAPASNDKSDATEDTEATDIPLVEQTAEVPTLNERFRHWMAHRTGMEAHERLRVMEAVGVHRKEGTLLNFGLMMLFSVLIATMGLSANSPAVVIGAMLLAPLMTPVIGTTASLSMAIWDELARSIVLLVAATVGAIVVAFVVGRFLPGTLTNEILGRTRPDARDLVVALAAGAAGSYATAKPDMSASLPGVAIAVALVPPLAVVGLTLEAGEIELAEGAMLLYVTNLVAIVAIGLLVFLLTGFTNTNKIVQQNATWKVILGSLIAVALAAAIAVPLVRTSLDATRDLERRAEVTSAVDVWILGSGLDVENIDISNELIAIEVSGDADLPDTAPLLAELDGIVGADTEVEIGRRTMRSASDLTADERAALEADRNALSAIQREQAVRAAIDAWWADGAAGPFAVTALDIGSDRVEVEITSAAEPPPESDLEARLRVDAGVADAQLTWVQPLGTVADTAPPATTDDETDDTPSVTEATDTTADNTDPTVVTQVLGRTEAALMATAQEWAASTPAATRVEVELTESALRLDITGTREPTAEALAALDARIATTIEAAANSAEFGDQPWLIDVPVSIWFSESRQLNS